MSVEQRLPVGGVVEADHLVAGVLEPRGRLGVVALLVGLVVDRAVDEHRDALRRGRGSPGVTWRARDQLLGVARQPRSLLDEQVEEPALEVGVGAGAAACRGARPAGTLRSRSPGRSQRARASSTSLIAWRSSSRWSRWLP